MEFGPHGDGEHGFSGWRPIASTGIGWHEMNGSPVSPEWQLQIGL